MCKRKPCLWIQEPCVSDVGRWAVRGETERLEVDLAAARTAQAEAEAEAERAGQNEVNAARDAAARKVERGEVSRHKVEAARAEETIAKALAAQTQAGAKAARRKADAAQSETAVALAAVVRLEAELATARAAHAGVEAGGKRAAQAAARAATDDARARAERTIAVAKVARITQAEAEAEEKLAGLDAARVEVARREVEVALHKAEVAQTETARVEGELKAACAMPANAVEDAGGAQLEGSAVSQSSAAAKCDATAADDMLLAGGEPPAIGAFGSSRTCGAKDGDTLRKAVESHRVEVGAGHALAGDGASASVGPRSALDGAQEYRAQTAQAPLASGRAQPMDGPHRGGEGPKVCDMDDSSGVANKRRRVGEHSAPNASAAETVADATLPTGGEVPAGKPSSGAGNDVGDKPTVLTQMGDGWRGRGGGSGCADRAFDNGGGYYAVGEVQSKYEVRSKRVRFMCQHGRECTANGKFSKSKGCKDCKELSTSDLTAK